MRAMMIAGVVSIGAYILADYLEPRIATWFKLSSSNTIGVKAIKYGTVGAAGIGTFWAVEHFFGKK